MKNYYKLLGLERTCSQSDIRKAYHKLARKYHPDVAINKFNATAKMASISEAYKILYNSESRAAYDRELDYTVPRSQHFESYQTYKEEPQHFESYEVYEEKPQYNIKQNIIPVSFKLFIILVLCTYSLIIFKIMPENYFVQVFLFIFSTGCFLKMFDHNFSSLSSFSISLVNLHSMVGSNFGFSFILNLLIFLLDEEANLLRLCISILLSVLLIILGAKFCYILP